MNKSARTRQRILDATARVLSLKGYAGTRLSDIAEQAEVQAPAIYYYWASREDVIEEVMWTGIARMRAHVRAALDALPPETGPLDRIDAAVEAHLRHMLEISDYARAAIRNSAQLPDAIRTRQLAEADRYGELWRSLVNDAAAELRPELDHRAARMLILGALNWAVEWWNPRRGSLTSLVQTAQSLVRHGLAG
jgi:TetR/AcrR family transcriptional regulator, cholesterol catabolism regulator